MSNEKPITAAEILRAQRQAPDYFVNQRGKEIEREERRHRHDADSPP